MNKTRNPIITAIMSSHLMRKDFHFQCSLCEKNENFIMFLFSWVKHISMCMYVYWFVYKILFNLKSNKKLTLCLRLLSFSFLIYKLFPHTQMSVCIYLTSIHLFHIICSEVFLQCFLMRDLLMMIMIVYVLLLIPLSILIKIDVILWAWEIWTA